MDPFKLPYSPDEAASALLALNKLVTLVYLSNRDAGWWDDADNLRVGPSGLPIVEDKYLLGTKIALIHSEASEMLEGMRKGAPDTHLPHRAGEEVECADLLIRVLDYAGARGFDLAKAFSEKMAYNEARVDHSREHRAAAGGKKF